MQTTLVSHSPWLLPHIPLFFFLFFFFSFAHSQTPSTLHIHVIMSPQSPSVYPDYSNPRQSMRTTMSRTQFQQWSQPISVFDSSSFSCLRALQKHLRSPQLYCHSMTRTLIHCHLSIPIIISYLLLFTVSTFPEVIKLTVWQTLVGRVWQDNHQRTWGGQRNAQNEFLRWYKCWNE